MRLIIVRHGETVENSARIVQGQMQGELSDRGRAQSEAVGEALRGYRIDAAYSSDLARAWETARIIAGTPPSMKFTAEPGLREQHMGRYQGGPVSALMRRYKDVGADFDPEGGEPAAAFRERVRGMVDGLSARHNGETVLAVTHYGFIWTFLDEYAGDMGGDRRLLTKNGMVTCATFEGSVVRDLWSIDCRA